MIINSSTMSINIQKGGNHSLTAAGHNRSQWFIGLGWSIRGGSSKLEIDASAFVLSENGAVCSDGSFIFYNQPCDDVAGFITLQETELSPAEMDEDAPNALDRQSFLLDLGKVPTSVSRIVFCLTIHDAEARGQTFKSAEQVHLRLVDPETGLETMRFQTENEFSTETAISMGELYRRGDEWKFRAVGQGYAGGLPALALGFGVKLTDSSPTAEETTPLPKEMTLSPSEPGGNDIVVLNKTRLTSKEIIARQALEVRSRLKLLLPQIMSAWSAGSNESSSRLILDKILQNVLGYSIEEIKAEQRIQGRTADYVLAPGGVDSVVIEAKRIGGPLKEKQIFQATSYAAYAGIKWAILTNVITWRLYKISTVDKIEPHLVFTVDISKGVSEEAAHYLTLISRSGIIRKTPLDRLWMLRRALSTESLVSAILHEDVLSRIRKVVAQENGIHLDIADIKAAVERDILKLD